MTLPVQFHTTINQSIG